jgi:hypothetical protein
MICGRWILGLSVAWLSVACSSSSSGGDSSGGLSASAGDSFAGIYQTTTYSKNSSGCDAPGASMLDTLQDKYFLIVGSQVFGENIVNVVSCQSVSDCQSKRTLVIAEGLYSFAYSYTLSSSVNATTLAGFEATTGFGDGTVCTGRTYSDHTLTLNPDHSVHLESRTKNLADMPMQDGFCDVQPAQSKQEAASLPCAELDVLDGTFVQAM